jgi:copper transport protein
VHAKTLEPSYSRTVLFSPARGEDAYAGQDSAIYRQAPGDLALRLDGSWRYGERGAHNSRRATPRATWRMFKLSLRATQYGAILAAAGGMLLLLLVGVPPAAKRATLVYVQAGAAIGLAGSLLLFGVAGAEAGDLALISLLTPDPWILGAGSDHAFSALFAIEGLTAVLAASMAPLSPRERGPWWMFGVAGALVATLALAAGGQVSTAEPRWFIGLTGAVHGVCASFWVGSLYPLMVSVRLGFRDECAATLAGFSRIAAGGVGALLAAGVIMSEAQLQDWRGFASPYGCCLMVKLGFVVGLLAVACLNTVKLQAMMERGSEKGSRLFAAALNVHMLFALGAIIATAALSLNPAPRSQDANARQTGRVMAGGEGLHATPHESEVHGLANGQ